MQAWSPYLAKDIECLERIQRRVTKMVRGLKNMNYQERLKAVGLQSLQQRKKRRPDRDIQDLERCTDY